MLRVSDKAQIAAPPARESCRTSVGQGERYLFSEIPTGLAGSFVVATRPGMRWNGEKLKFDASLQANHLAQAKARGVGTIVTLLETAEPSYRTDCARLGLAVTHQPIENFHVPSHDEALRTVRGIIKALSAGTDVMVHCMGGKGRSGTIAACTLIALGHDADSAIALVRAHRHESIETPAQMAFIASFARLYRGACVS